MVLAAEPSAVDASLDLEQEKRERQNNERIRVNRWYMAIDLIQVTAKFLASSIDLLQIG
jgi:hypothetical protein